MKRLTHITVNTSSPRPTPVTGAVSALVCLMIAISWDTPSAAAQYGPHGCTWGNLTANVWSNPGTIAANGFSVDQFRLELQAAISTWNEESQTPGPIQYAGDTSSTVPIPGAILVTHQNTWACTNNTSAKAFWSGHGSCATDPPAPNFIMIMQDSCNPGTPRMWRAGWPGPSVHDPWGLAGTMPYEGVATHELGHTLGMFDFAGSAGVMNPSGAHTAHLHLYPNDVQQLRGVEGTTFLRPHTIDSANGSSWTSSPLAATPSSMVSSLVPAIGGQMPGANAMRISMGEAWLRYAPVRTGAPGAWSSHAAASAVLDVDSWVSVATSDFGELLVVWVDDCTGTNSCNIDWAWTNNSGSSWSTGTLSDTNTYARPSVAYDRGRDRFVLAYIDDINSQVITRSSPAISSPVWSSAFGTSMAPYRYLGGMIFNASGTGMIFAAANTATTRGRIAQFTMGGSGSTYSIVNGTWLTSQSNRTNRSFGVAYSRAQNRIVVIWKEWPFQVWRTTRTGIGSLAAFPAPTAFASHFVSSGVDAAVNLQTDRFVATWAN